MLMNIGLFQTEAWSRLRLLTEQSSETGHLHELADKTMWNQQRVELLYYLLNASKSKVACMFCALQSQIWFESHDKNKVNQSSPVSSQQVLVSSQTGCNRCDPCWMLSGLVGGFTAWQQQFGSLVTPGGKVSRHDVALFSPLTLKG